ncbi:MAG: homoprotocatechuate degradation operon regulator HpaR [Agarilytica sp.]
MPVDIESVTSLLLKAREGAVSCIKPVLTQHDLTEQQWRVIRELKKHGDLNAQKLARESGILSPSLSRILARFTDVGVVVRKVDKEDQRAQSIRLSAKGKRLHDKIFPKIEKQHKAMVKSVGNEKLSRLHDLLIHVSEKFPE